MTICFAIPGPPRGKARPRVTKRGVTYTPKETADYERWVRICWQAAGGGRFPEGTALLVDITARFPVAKSVSGRERAAMLSGKKRPTKKPDGDNIVKIICDALNGCAYRDDAAVVEVVFRKYYGDGPGETVVRIQDI